MDAGSDKIISLAAAREEREPHLSGTCICGACRHQWIGTSPVGVTELECPNCGVKRGRHKFDAVPEDGTGVYVCNTCDGMTFTILRGSEVMCCGCGTRHRPWDCE